MNSFVTTIVSFFFATALTISVWHRNPALL